MAAQQGNTWPPLISSGSQDAQGRQQLYGGAVLASCLLTSESDDEFFHPVDLGLTGYSFRGVMHQNGAVVPDVPKASWYTETPGDFRGDTPEFPSKGLVLVTDAGISLISTQDNTYALWMGFLRGDVYAFTHNVTQGMQGFSPMAASYQNGRVLVALAPDVGAEVGDPAFLVFDFVLDRVYLEWSTTPAA